MYNTPSFHRAAAAYEAAEERRYMDALEAAETTEYVPFGSVPFAATIELLGYLALHEKDYPEMMARVAAARAEIAHADTCPECGGELSKRCLSCDQAGQ